eukprot:3813214-Rhodomonas_salina.2
MDARAGKEARKLMRRRAHERVMRLRERLKVADAEAGMLCGFQMTALSVMEQYAKFIGSNEALGPT